MSGREAKQVVEPAFSVRIKTHMHATATIGTSPTLTAAMSGKQHKE